MTTRPRQVCDADRDIVDSGGEVDDVAGTGDAGPTGSSSGDAAEPARLKQHVLDAFRAFEATAEDFQNPKQE
jgi:hypothetical protein